MEVSCVTIELKPNCKQRVREWASFILSNQEEAVDTLINEAVTLETFFLIEIESKDFLIGYMRAKSIRQANKAVIESLSEIDAYHQQFKKDTWAKGVDSELLFDLSRLENEDDIA